MTPEQIKVSQTEIDRIIDLALHPASDAESKDAKVIRRILRREVNDLLREDSEGELHSLDQLSVDLDKVTNQLREKISRDESRSEEFRELIALLKRESSTGTTEETSLNLATRAALVVVASTAAVGGLVGGIPGAIVAAAAAPFLLKVTKSIKNRSS